MATAQLITIDNYDTLLVQSTESRTGSPDGNVFFDTANDLIELIGADELANVDLGGGAEANPLTNFYGITLQALYAFTRQERRLDDDLRKFLPPVGGTFKYAGAFQFLNGVKLDGTDRAKIRGSGWIEYSNSGAIDRVYFGPRSLNAIQAGSQPYYQLPASLSAADLQSADPVNFGRVGPIDEAVQVFGTTANGDTGAGDFDYRTRPLVTRVRTWQYNYGSTTSTGSGVSELAPYSAGFGVGETANSANTYDLVDVFGGSAIAPWSTMTYTHYGTPQSRSGFTDGSANFSDIIANPADGSLLQLRAYLDALMLQDTDCDAGAGTFYPKRADPLYSINASGQIVTRAGLHIDDVPEADRSGILQTDDSGVEHAYVLNVEVRIKVSSSWVNDMNAWGQCYYVDGAGGLDFETASAVTVNDADGDPVVVTEADAVAVGDGTYEIRFSYAYSTNTQAGLTANTDKAVVFLAEGDGGAKPASAFFTITSANITTASCLSDAETNL